MEKSIEEQILYGEAYNASFCDAAEIYLKQGGSPRYLDKVLESMGDLILRKITQKILDEKADEIYGHCAPQTKNRHFYTPFISVWNANTHGHNALCQPIKWKRPKVIKRKKATISKAVSYKEAITFINALHKPVAELMFFLFYTGCRPIEAILLDEADVKVEDNWLILNETKTNKPRGIPIHRCLEPMLYRRLRKKGSVFTNSLAKPWPDTRKYNKSGRLIYQSGGQFQGVIETAQKKTGLHHITPYTARHTVSTHLIHPGGVSKVVKDEILGHGESGDISLDYIHLPRQAHIDAINKLPVPVGLREDLLI